MAAEAIGCTLCRDMGASNSNLPLKMLQLVSGHWVSQAIRTAAILGVADKLADGGKHVDELAKDLDAHAGSLLRLLRALSGIGIFAESLSPGVFELTPLADLLRTDSDRSMRHVAIFNASEELYKPWCNAHVSVKTGKSAVEETFGMELFEYYRRNPEAGERFDLAMTAYSRIECPALLAAYDFSGISMLMDVGGGQGYLLSAILGANPAMKGILLDLPHVIERARLVMEPLSDRCSLVPGSFFEALPSGADAIVMKSILHDWAPEKQVEILKRCHAALPVGGKLLVVERVIPPGNVEHPAKWMDMQMLVMLGGMERSAEDYREFFKLHGFNMLRVVPVEGTEVSLVETVKAGDEEGI